CIVTWDFVRSNRIVRIPSRARSTWNWNCETTKDEVHSALLHFFYRQRFQRRDPRRSRSPTRAATRRFHGIRYSPEGKKGRIGPHRHSRLVGLNDWVKEQASKLADQGYVALAIDLYRRKIATTANEAHEFMGGVPRER